MADDSASIFPSLYSDSKGRSISLARVFSQIVLRQVAQRYILNSQAMNSEENTQLEYNEALPPSHDLHIQTQPGFEVKQVTSRKMNNDVLAVKFDREGEMLALGCKNGTRLIYSVLENKFIVRADDVKENAITSIKWRPSGESKSKILAAADAGGHVTFLHVPSLKPLFTLQEHQNSINTLDFSWTGKIFATGGKDCHVRIYDQDTKTVVHDFQPAGWNNVGHDNRVFAVKFIDEHTLISGGWDSVVHVWDIRQARSAHHFYGPNISGESLDYENGMVLAGCYAAQKQLQFWNIKTLQKVQEIDWTSGNIDDAQYIYAAGFSRRNPEIFGAGSTGPNSEVRLFKENPKNPHQHELIAQVSGLNQGCFSLDFSAKTNQFCFTTPHHGFYLYEYK